MKSYFAERTDPKRQGEPATLAYDADEVDVELDKMQHAIDGARALLLLLENGNVTAYNFDTMIDRIIESRANDHQYRSG